VTKDLYTTLLLDFQLLKTKTTDFAILKNRSTGLFDFTLTVFDLFGIIGENATVKKILENLINTLKPGNSRAFIKYYSD
jgi:hypothetical protein